jgi:hypothetical protein
MMNRPAMVQYQSDAVQDQQPMQYPVPFNNSLLFNITRGNPVETPGARQSVPRPAIHNPAVEGHAMPVSSRRSLFNPRYLFPSIKKPSIPFQHR